MGVLAASLGLFFLGGPAPGVESGRALTGIANSDPFMLVFAIVFPAFTGMTAGVGLSGDLKNPKRSIPLGILSATLVGILVYVALVWKLWASAPPELLASDQMVMARIAPWGPAMPLALACATISSALGSIMVAPRTLQALAAYRIVPFRRLNVVLAAGASEAKEPRNATLVTGVIAFAVVALGSVDLVARIVSMFFMVTYGALCTISFFEHFAARPSYRPAFRSRWWISLVGAVFSALLMFQMDPLFAVLAIFTMVGLYALLLHARGGVDDLAAIFHGVMTQATRYLQVKLQKVGAGDWRPALVMISGRTFERKAPFQLLSWIGHRHGFANYLHYLEGRLTPETYRESRAVQEKLVEVVGRQRSAIYVDTMVSPSMSSALAQTLQTPGVSGMETTPCSSSCRRTTNRASRRRCSRAAGSLRQRG